MDEHGRPPARPRVAVVFGGRSSEHAISCATAAGVLGALDRDAWDVVPVGVTREGRWVLAADDPGRWRIAAGGALPEVTAGDGPQVLVPTAADERDLVVLEPDRVPRALGAVDVVLPLLHGPYGEDGTLQGLLEMGSVRYAGSGVLASALSMDKHVARTVLAGAGLPVGPWTALLPGQWEHDPEDCRRRVGELGWPVFVKPARAGSSIGISRVTGPHGLDAAVELALRHDPKVVVEAGVPGVREVECGVLQDVGPDGRRAVSTSLPGEVVVGGEHEFYDFEAKYLDEASVQLLCPAPLDEETTARVRQIAVRAFEAVGAEGLARVDLFLTGDGQLLVNEINTMPGFTQLSMFPRMWAATGVGYPELVDRLLRHALARPTGLR
ncbi:D-alanine--D-alanine ligase family protein [Quadrisphaera sp. DSM 44207]|uniref:D-alanine--D-alanine ligase family protein n=1 Tax=Quadrisphaera sp. DSM 44207 TaxID=1881057 RepID=UPI00088A4E91|nr:D-alanine--D-alanine ligase family protein [Quadrisphaera sp. DSM 44207]SDQ75378.1 D-alanine--D-alanine ligase [Quadrisphaera sp. DSM 44207]